MDRYCFLRMVDLQRPSGGEEEAGKSLKRVTLFIGLAVYTVGVLIMVFIGLAVYTVGVLIMVGAGLTGTCRDRLNSLICSTILEPPHP